MFRSLRLASVCHFVSGIWCNFLVAISYFKALSNFSYQFKYQMKYTHLFSMAFLPLKRVHLNHHNTKADRHWVASLQSMAFDIIILFEIDPFFVLQYFCYGFGQRKIRTTVAPSSMILVVCRLLTNGQHRKKTKEKGRNRQSHPKNEW